MSSRVPGYYWIQPEKGGEWLVGYWYEGCVDVFGSQSPGYFDCSNHWGDHKQVFHPFCVGSRLEPGEKTRPRKSDVSQLRSMAKQLEKEELRLLKTSGPEIVPRSIRAANLSNLDALKRTLDVIDAMAADVDN